MMTLSKRRGLAGLMLAALTAVPLGVGAQDTPADWVKRPSRQDLLTVWPRSAWSSGRGGKATIDCTVTAQGALRDCRVISEAPQGAGFGAAAMTLSAQFAMKPATRNGRPVDIRVQIPIVFPDFDIPTGSHLPGQGPSPRLGNRVISGVRWTEAPSVADVLAVYPGKARASKISGRVTLDCVIGKLGAIAGCSAIQEEPDFQGFGSAARKLAPKFVGPTVDAAGASLVGVHIQLPVVFAAESLTSESSVIGKPQWATLPRGGDLVAVYPAAAAKAGVLKARVVLSCTVSAGGALAACVVASEDPVGYEIGKATLGLAGAFKLGVWSSEGLPTVGGVVRVPIRYDFSGEPPAKP